jgi:hypothetical protein
LNMRRIATKFVPRLLTNDQKQRCINVCLELRQKANEDAILSLGSWWVTKVGFTVMIQSNNWHSGRAHNHQGAKKAVKVRRSTKSTLIFFRSEGDCSP